MQYANFVKRIEISDGFQTPNRLSYEDITAKPLTRDDLQADMQAVNSSLDIICKTRGGSWPAVPVSEAFDYLDLAWHEREFRDGDSFAYVVYSDANVYIGCFYLYGMGHRTALEENLLKYQVDASWWVTSDAYQKGYYKKLQTALDGWLSNEFGFTQIYYSNKEM